MVPGSVIAVRFDNLEMRTERLDPVQGFVEGDGDHPFGGNLGCFNEASRLGVTLGLLQVIGQ